MAENAAEFPSEPAAVRDVLTPAAIDRDALARMLGLPADAVSRHIDEGAPVNRDGTLNLIHYAAWLNTPAPGNGPGPADQSNEDADVAPAID